MYRIVGRNLRFEDRGVCWDQPKFHGHKWTPPSLLLTQGPQWNSLLCGRARDARGSLQLVKVWDGETWRWGQMEQAAVFLRSEYVREITVTKCVMGLLQGCKIRRDVRWRAPQFCATSPSSPHTHLHSCIESSSEHRGFIFRHPCRVAIHLYFYCPPSTFPHQCRCF